jgi:hypothetical protein
VCAVTNIHTISNFKASRELERQRRERSRNILIQREVNLTVFYCMSYGGRDIYSDILMNTVKINPSGVITDGGGVKESWTEVQRIVLSCQCFYSRHFLLVRKYPAKR